MGRAGPNFLGSWEGHIWLRLEICRSGSYSTPHLEPPDTWAQSDPKPCFWKVQWSWKPRVSVILEIQDFGLGIFSTIFDVFFRLLPET